MEVDRRDETRFCKPNRSEISVQTAGTVNVGRGTTIQFVHASELAFYANPETMFTGFEQAISDSPGTFAFKESTANGAGNYFFREWNNAEAGLSSYVGKFYSWWGHVGYKLAFHSAGELDDFKRGLSKEENALLDLGCSFKNLKWRRRTIITKCQNDPRRFKQEYPATAQEAFLTSGRPTFDPEQMAKLLTLTKRTEPIFTGSLQAIDE